jgi:hypothetical protein
MLLVTTYIWSRAQVMFKVHIKDALEPHSQGSCLPLRHSTLTVCKSERPF